MPNAAETPTGKENSPNASGTDEDRRNGLASTDTTNNVQDHPEDKDESINALRLLSTSPADYSPMASVPGNSATGIANPAFEMDNLEEKTVGGSSSKQGSKSDRGSIPKLELHEEEFTGGYATVSAGISRRQSVAKVIDEHVVPLEELLFRFNSNKDRGLSDLQVQANRLAHGANILIPPDKPSQVFLLFKEFFIGLNILLWACAILALGSYFVQFFFSGEIVPDNCILGVCILIVIAVSGLFAFYQEFKSHRIMESFKNMVPRFTKVYRNGHLVTLDVSELVVGDIVDLRYGDIVPADIRIIESHDFKVDNSGLTGESKPQKRTVYPTDDDPMESKNLAFFSTSAVEGHCKGIVIRVGSSTCMGNLAAIASKVSGARTPIGIEMDLFINIMTIRSIIFGSVFFAVALIMGYDILDSIFFVIGIVVANVPEGLCVTFTMVLALTAKRMAKKNCLVKNLHAVETLGSTSVICTDKTGTLTMNKMSVAHLWFNNIVWEADTSKFTPEASFNNSDPGFKALSNVVMLCSRAVFRPGQDDIPIPHRVVDGDASEAALLKFMEEQDINVAEYRRQHYRKLDIPFNSSSKYHISVFDMQDPEDSRYLLVMKGAPEKVMSMCTTILIDGEERVLDQYWKEAYIEVYAGLGSLGERVLGFCDRRLPKKDYPVGHDFKSEEPQFLNLGFRFLGLISMVDPPRAAVPDAVARCRSAGIKVVMVTGDHPVTATAIARATGILTQANQTIEEIALERGVTVNDVDPCDATAAVISGAELKLLSSTELENVLCNYKEIVFARTSPEQKYRIVDGFQRLGHIVASTGDGVNDSPALKKADIGIAMGISGTEVSKEVADMILMDDNFSTIVAGVEEGRLIFDNLKKLIAYNLADNIAEMYSVWVFIMLRCPLPMGTIAMLLSVIGTDVAPAISIAYEKAESDIMKLRPRDPKLDKLVTPQLLSYTYGQTSMFELLSGFFSYFVLMAMNGWMPWELIGSRSQWESEAINDLPDSYGQEWTYSSRKILGITAQTAFFASIVLTQISNVIVCKTRRMSLFQQGMRNWSMNIAIVVEICLMLFFIYTPGVNSLLILAGIPPIMFLAPVPFMLLMIFYDELRRWAVRTFRGGWIHSEFYT